MFITWEREPKLLEGVIVPEGDNILRPSLTDMILVSQRFRPKLNWIFMPPFSNTAVLETSGEAEDRGGEREGE